jgi:peptidoglycan/xylan/chitin deacetylase (PgdA/CDA1 family)
MAVDTAFRCGFRSWVRHPRPVRRILIYHGVTGRDHRDVNSRTLPIWVFRSQLQWFRHHTTVVPLEDFVAGARDPHRPTIALTFDDGLRSARTTVLPELLRHQLPATFFVTAAGADGARVLWPDALDLVRRWGPDEIIVCGRRFRRGARRVHADADGVPLAQGALEWAPEFLCKAADELLSIAAESIDLTNLADLWQPLNADGVEQLAQTTGITLGAHGISHAALDNQPDRVVEDEINRSVRWLEDRSGGSRTIGFAWPFGRWTAHSLDVARHCGVQHQFLVDPPTPQSSDDHDLWPRFVINPFVSWPVVAHAIQRGSW